MRAAIDRRTARGVVVGPAERIEPARALALFGDPAASCVRAGMAADLVLLAAPPQRVLARLRRDEVVATVVAGDIVHDARWDRLRLSRGPRPVRRHHATVLYH